MMKKILTKEVKVSEETREKLGRIRERIKELGGRTSPLRKIMKEE